VNDGGHDLEESREGLAFCRTCGGTEGSIPTECPGRQMLTPEADRVYAGSLDFVNGAWTVNAVKGLVIRIRDHSLPGCPITAVSRW